MSNDDSTVRARVDSVWAISQRIPGTFGNVENPVGLLVASGVADANRRAALWYVFQREGTPSGEVQYGEDETQVFAKIPTPESSMAALCELARAPNAHIRVSRDAGLCAMEASPIVSAEGPRPTPDERRRVGLPDLTR